LSEEYLKRRDPSGYYVILLKPSAREKLRGLSNVVVEESGGILVVRVKSRSVAKRLLEKLKDFLLNP